MRVTNIGKRAFIVKRESVKEGGELRKETGEVAINPGDTVEVSDACGKILKTYSEIRVFGERKGKRNVDDTDKG